MNTVNIVNATNQSSAGRALKRRALVVLLLVCGSAWLMETRASAQLGSLVVTIASPSNGATVSGTTTITANVSIIGSLTVSGVQFKVDGVNVGAEDTTAPYSIPWNTTTASNGSHTLTAVGRAVLLSWTSDPVTVTVANDVTPPAVTINQAAGQSDPTSASSISFTAVFSEPVSGFTGTDVTISGTAGGTKAVTISGGPSTYTVAVSGMTTDGSVIATIPAGRAADAAGNVNTASTSTDNTVSFVAPDTTPPTVTINQAAGQGDPTSASSINFTAVFSESVTGFTGTDIAISGTAGGTKTVTLSGGPSTYTVAVSGMTTDGTVAATIAAGSATDAAGNANTASTSTDNTVSFVAPDTTAPTVAITSPAAGATVSGTITVGATASDNVAVIGVQFRLDGAPLGAEDTSAPYDASWNTTTAADGSHTLTAVARDAAGNTTASSGIAVTVANNQAEATTRLEDTSSEIVYTPAGAWMLGYSDSRAWSGGTAALGFGASQRATLSFTGTGVKWIGFRGPQTGIANVYLDSALVATIDAYSSTEIMQAVLYTVSGLANATHTISIEVTRTKNDASSDFYVIVDAFDITAPGGGPSDTTPPSVNLTSPVGGTTVFGTVTLSATAADNVGVASVQFYVDGNPFGAADTQAPYETSWNTTAVSEGPHSVMAQARDAAGNTQLSQIVHVTVTHTDPTPPGSNVRIEDGNTAITYHGSWNVGNASRPWSGGTAAIGFGVGQDAVVSFRGTGITWIGFRGPWVGIANVYVDGTLAGTIDGYATAEAVQAPMFTVTGLPLGMHTLTIEVTRTKNAASSDYVVISDAFDIIDAPPDTTAPSISITTPAGGATVFATVPFRASADDDSGVAAVTFFVDGLQVDNADTISPYSINWNTTTVADGSHTLTAVARDAAGNTTTSAPVTVIVANAAPPALATATRIENTDLGILYVDGCASCGQPASWFHGSRSRAWSDGTSSFNRADGGRATFAFTGTAVKWIGFRAAWAGIARVFVDGAFVTEVDLFSPTEEVQVPVFQVSDLAPGTHTIAVEATGRKNAEAQDYAVVVDAFDVSPGLPPPVAGTRFEESASSATFTSGWNMTDTTQAWSGGTAASASGVGERATFVFTGTSVKWVGKRAPDMGIARVYLDGAFQALVDGYYPVTIQGLVYSVTGLAPGQHRLEIEVTGLQHNQATGHAIIVDAFDVRSRIEENDAPVVYSGAWSLNGTMRNWSDTSLTTGTGTASFADTAGARADLTFAGTAVTWIGLRAPWVGIADVYVDGAFAQQIDLYSTTEQVQAPIFTASGLASGTHTLRIQATGTRNPAATTARVYVDTFDVTLPVPSPQVTRVQDTDAAVAYSAGWVASGTSNLWSGANAKESRTVGAQATFGFSGTSIRWLGERGFATGLARVSIDGQFVALVDTRTPFQEEYQEPVFIATGLAPGAHTLTIEIAGRNNEAPGSIVERVVIDAFDIHQQ